MKLWLVAFVAFLAIANIAIGFVGAVLCGRGPWRRSRAGSKTAPPASLPVPPPELAPAPAPLSATPLPATPQPATPQPATPTLDLPAEHPLEQHFYTIARLTMEMADLERDLRRVNATGDADLLDACRLRFKGLLGVAEEALAPEHPTWSPLLQAGAAEQALAARLNKRTRQWVEHFPSAWGDGHIDDAPLDVLETHVLDACVQLYELRNDLERALFAVAGKDHNWLPCGGRAELAATLPTLPIDNPAVLTIGVLELDQFGMLNHQVGPAVVDEVLEEIDGFLRAEVEPRQRLLRVAGRRWVVVDPAGILELVDRWRAALDASQFRVDGQALKLSASAVATAALADDDVDTLLQRLETTLQNAHEQGGSRTVVASAGGTVTQPRLAKAAPPRWTRDLQGAASASLAMA